ncbi:MAG: sulfite exporter TauE/SafE family protein [Solirubrobacteraceae bacterium]
MIWLVLTGLAAGLLSGMLGVGGGVLFVPALVVAVAATQVEAEATSLLAILPVAVVGAWSQRRYGNVRLKEAGLIGVLSIAGAVGGVALANALPERALKLAFAALSLAIAVQLVLRVRRRVRAREADGTSEAAGP